MVLQAAEQPFFRAGVAPGAGAEAADAGASTSTGLDLLLSRYDSRMIEIYDLKGLSFGPSRPAQQAFRVLVCAGFRS